MGNKINMILALVFSVFGVFVTHLQLEGTLQGLLYLDKIFVCILLFLVFYLTEEREKSK